MSMTSRHALITSMTIHLTPNYKTDPKRTRKSQEYLDALALSLIGRRYESLEGIEQTAIFEGENQALGEEVVAWMRGNM